MRIVAFHTQSLFADLGHFKFAHVFNETNLLEGAGPCGETLVAAQAKIRATVGGHRHRIVIPVTMTLQWRMAYLTVDDRVLALPVRFGYVGMAIGGTAYNPVHKVDRRTLRLAKSDPPIVVGFAKRCRAHKLPGKLSAHKDND